MESLTTLAVLRFFIFLHALKPIVKLETGYIFEPNFRPPGRPFFKSGEKIKDILFNQALKATLSLIL
jgi:hypothetical protein